MEAFTPDFYVGVEHLTRDVNFSTPFITLSLFSALQCSDLVLMHEIGCSIRIWRITRCQLYNMVIDLDGYSGRGLSP